VELVMAVGPENAFEWSYIDQSLRSTYIGDLKHELSCGIARRVDAILEALERAGDPTWGDLIKSMGQLNSKRVAEFIWEIAEETTEWSA
jgi:hypothetical protein